MREKPQIKKLNLGSGEFKKDGYINLDVTETTNPDVIHDLNVVPYPFPDNSFSVVEGDHVLEHVDDPFAVMREVHRILEPSGLVTIRVPHFSRALTHPDHKSGFDFTFPFYFQSSFKGGYMGVEFSHVSTRLRWFAQPYLKKTVMAAPVVYAAMAAGSVINAVAALSPMVCSRLWCYWVGGFEEIEFRLRARKSTTTA